jgi:hemolysin-activating ACP:hemolysin acyltransferase
MIDIKIEDDFTEEESEIISLYHKFDKYKKYTKSQLKCHIEPALKLKQYKTHSKGGQIVAFTSWAFLDERSENHYKKTGQMLYNFWKSGDRCWIVDSICHDDNFNAVYEWAKRYFTMQLGLNKPVSWLRIDDNYKISECKTKETKKEYLNG